VKVFLSWSGTKARFVATAMKVFLQDVNQRTIVWFSVSDILAGERWGLKLATELEGTDYGIICVTQESLQSPWTLFEAGALAKSVTGSRVCPYLIDVRADQLSGPFAQFQAKRATKDETWELLQAVNLAMDSDALPEVRLKKYFDTFWPDLEAVLSQVNSELQALPRDIGTQLIEVLSLMFYKVSEIEMFALGTGLPIWEVNLNQAAFYVWRELIQVAASEKRLGELLDRVVDYAPASARKLTSLREEVRPWSQS
jgi:hypothetical protein